jgi:hypothetical protein
MNKETRQLTKKAVNSLILCIDHFNRPWDRGRTEAVLLLLDHAFEMLLKAGIRHKGEKIRIPRAKRTISLKDCIAKCLTDKNVKFLTEEQAILLQSINGQRDAAQHYLLDISEHHLYFYAQAGVTLFRDIHDSLFKTKLMSELPERVLPISTTAPKNLTTLFETETKEIANLLKPGRRKQMDAIARVRSLAVLESTVNGEFEQPSDIELRKICLRLANGEKWGDVFPGVATIDISSDPNAAQIQLRLTKKEGLPIQLVKEGEGGGAVLSVKRVNELEFYNMGWKQLCRKFKIGQNKLHAVIWKNKLLEDDQCYKEIKIGKSSFKRYSEKAIPAIKKTVEDLDIDEVWEEYKAFKKQ